MRSTHLQYNPETTTQKQDDAGTKSVDLREDNDEQRAFMAKMILSPEEQFSEHGGIQVREV